MKQAVMTTAIILTMAGTAAAQTGGGSNAAETSAAQNAQPGIVAAIGCVQAGASASEGAQGANYMLINAGLASSSAVAGSPPASATYLLEGYDLSPYIGHTVQVIATTGGAASTGAAANSLLRVTSAVRLGTSCSSQTSR